MKVILKEDVANLGFANEVVEVKPGYGRNFLIPKGLAVMASESALKVLAENLKQQEHKHAVIKQRAEELARKLDGKRAELKVRTTNTGTIYGSISAAMVADALEAQGLEINRKMLQVPGGIKEIGEYTAKVRLHKDVTVEIPVIVESENAAEIEAARLAAKQEAEAIEAERAARKKAQEKAESTEEEATEATAEVVAEDSEKEASAEDTEEATAE